MQVRSLAGFLLIVFGIWLAVLPAQAQFSLPAVGAEASVDTADLQTPEAVRALVSTLSDSEVRALLLERLDAVAAAAEAEALAQPPLLDAVVSMAKTTASSLVSSASLAPNVPFGIAHGLSVFFAPRGWSGLLTLVGVMLLAVAAGFAAEWVIDRIASKWRERIRSEVPAGLGQTLGLLLRRAFLDIVGLIAFFIVARQVLFAFLSGDAPPTGDGTRSFPDVLIATSFLGSVILLPRVSRALTRFLLAPSLPALRLVHTDDWTAWFLHRQQALVFFIWGLTTFMVPFLASHQVAMGELRVGFWLTLWIYATLFYTVWRARAGLTMMLMGRDFDVTPGEAWAARAYPWFVMVLIGLTWLMVESIAALKMFHLLDGRQHLTLLVFAFAPTFDTMVRGLVKHLVPPMSGEGELAEIAHIRTRRSFIRIGRVLLSIIVVLWIARLWQLDLTNLAAAGVGQTLAGRMVEIVMIVLAGYLVWEVVSLWINRKLADEQTAAAIDLKAEEPGGGEGGQAGGSRLSTVLPLLLGALRTAIVVIFGLIAFGNLGIDITPLLAGAGIAGLAIGFGAQKLVTDVVSGIFFLVDDAFRTGEYVSVEGTMGTVEKISIRSMQLRHHKGPVHTLPYGEIPKITNYSRDWVIMKLKFTVPFETDPNLVKKLFKRVGQEMSAEPEFAEDFLQPFKSQGVFDFDDVGMIMRGKFMAKPGRQFVLRKEIYNRVKAAFEANGISFARREVRVALPNMAPGKELSESEKAAISAVAAQAASPTEKPPAA